MQKRSESEVRENAPSNKRRTKESEARTKLGKQPQNSPKQGRKFFLGTTTRPNQQRAKFGRFFLTFNKERTKRKPQNEAWGKRGKVQNEQRANKEKHAKLRAQI